MTMYAMSQYARRRARPTKPRSVHAVEEGIDASRRVAWAKFYEEQSRAERLATLKAMSDARCDDLVEMLMELTDAVLTKSNMQAFGIAHKIRTAVDAFIERQRGRTA